MTETGRVTLPIECGLGEKLPQTMKRLGADAVRNSDGTELPPEATELGAKIYATYFPARGDQEWALAHPEHRPCSYLQTERVPAFTDGDLEIQVMKGFLTLQIEPNQECDTTKWWQVIDRTTGETIAPENWDITGKGANTVVTVKNARAGHVYTVNFLGFQTWDSTQMYNYITNNWEEDPTRVREQPYDVRHEETWEYAKTRLRKWLADRPEVDVVRFTTFFYHFTLVFNEKQKEKFVDWFGYTASLSVAALEAFEAEYYEITPEDLVDCGYYNTAFRQPSKTFLDWMEFQTRFVCDRARQLVDIVHEAGREAMMFLGDNWIGTEPYGEHFASIGLDAVVGSVGSAATCRMISDIPGVKYTEGRFLPYFFPDVFNPGGDPVGEAKEFWSLARRAIVRSPLDRIGYGGYLSLALQFPEFMEEIDGICNQFRELHTITGGQKPLDAPFEVAIVNAWGARRSWQTHMVAHALPYKQAEPYLGVLEALAGLPFKVRFLSFDDIRDGVPEGIGVIINAGEAHTAFAGGHVWADPQLQASVRAFVAGGGGFIGVGEPTMLPQNGAVLQLSDVLGVDRELGWALSTDNYPKLVAEHFITAQLSGKFDAGTGRGDVFALNDDTDVLCLQEESVRIAARSYGRGRSVYLAGLPYSFENARLLQRALWWAAGREDQWAASAHCDDSRVEVAHFDQAGRILVCNLADEDLKVEVHFAGHTWDVELEASGSSWIVIDS